MHFENKGSGPKGGTYLVCDAARRRMGCQRTGWRYEHFEAAFLAFVHEIDLEPIVCSEENFSARRELDDAVQALEGKRSKLEAEREYAYQLLGITNTDFVAAKLDDCERTLSQIRFELKELHDRRAALTVDVGSLYFSKEELKSLIDGLRDRDKSAAYKLRAQIAAKLRSVLAELIVAPAGYTLTNAKTIGSISKDTQKYRERGFSDFARPRGRRRYFLARFKDGSYRAVYPNDDDPLEYDEQIIQKRKLLEIMSAGRFLGS